MPAAAPTRTAYHESGHCTAALAVGVPIKHATLPQRYVLTTPRGPNCARTRWRRALIALAGPAAEIVWAGYTAPERELRWDTTWSVDQSNALRHLDDGDIDLCLRRATAIVCQHWDWVERLARALQQRQELTGAEIYALIGSSPSVGDPLPTISASRMAQQRP